MKMYKFIRLVLGEVGWKEGEPVYVRPRDIAQIGQTDPRLCRDDDGKISETRLTYICRSGVDKPIFVKGTISEVMEYLGIEVAK